jgi:hypothetical protein
MEDEGESFFSLISAEASGDGTFQTPFTLFSPSSLFSRFSLLSLLFLLSYFSISFSPSLSQYPSFSGVPVFSAEASGDSTCSPNSRLFGHLCINSLANRQIVLSPQ